MFLFKRRCVRGALVDVPEEKIEERSRLRVAAVCFAFVVSRSSKAEKIEEEIEAWQVFQRALWASSVENSRQRRHREVSYGFSNRIEG